MIIFVLTFAVLALLGLSAGFQEFSLAGRQPTLARLRLTLGTVPISAPNGERSISCLMGSFF